MYAYAKDASVILTSSSDLILSTNIPRAGFQLPFLKPNIILHSDVLFWVIYYIPWTFFTSLSNIQRSIIMKCSGEQKKCRSKHNVIISSILQSNPHNKVNMVEKLSVLMIAFYTGKVYIYMLRCDCVTSAAMK